MNRAFVKEADGDDVVEPLYERQHSDLPNYITPEGLLHLKNRIRILENSYRRPVENRLRWRKSLRLPGHNTICVICWKEYTEHKLSRHPHHLKKSNSVSLLYLRTKKVSRTVSPWLERTKLILIRAGSAGQHRLENSSVVG